MPGIVLIRAWIVPGQLRNRQVCTGLSFGRPAPTPAHAPRDLVARPCINGEVAHPTNLITALPVPTPKTVRRFRHFAPVRLLIFSGCFQLYRNQLISV